MILDVRDIRKSFGGVTALDGASFSLKPGTITSLFGANGSGKSTLFNIISGYLHADDGSVRLKGSTLNGSTPVARAREGIGRTWQSPRVFKDLNVLDNLLMAAKPVSGNWFGALLGTGATTSQRALRTKAEAVLNEVGLNGRGNDTAGSLSLGQQKLLSVAMLMMRDPELLLLDEVFAGVAPAMVQHIADVLRALKAQGHTILLIEHNTSVARSISDQVLEMRGGRVDVIKPYAL